MLFLLTDSPQKLKLEKINGTFIILFYMSMSSPQLKRLFFFLLKTQKTIPLKKTKNLQDELNQLEKNKQKVPSFMLTLEVTGG